MNKLPEIKVTAFKEQMNGEEALITVEICSGENKDIQKYSLSALMLTEVDGLLPLKIPKEISSEGFDKIEELSELWRAVKKGIDLLNYADNTKRALITKLRARGFDKYLSEDAALYLEEHGYINETRQIEREFIRLANTKRLGKSRIKNELFKKGFEINLIEKVLKKLGSEVDFEENLLYLLEKKCDPERLSDEKYRSSVYRSMYSYGYSISETAFAIKKMKNEKKYEE